MNSLPLKTVEFIVHILPACNLNLGFNLSYTHFIPCPLYQFQVVSCLVVERIFLVLLLPSARWCTFLLLMYNQPRPGFFFVPFKPGEYRKFELVISLFQKRSTAAIPMLTLTAFYLLFELFVDCVQCIFDCHTFQIPGSDFKPQREMQINLLDGGCCKELLQRFLLI